ncbi:TetR/AcrR family transcriptional regulator [Nocardioides sp. GY 10127]|uniref:TetR/AcrR family transcriptional regulator n=1 Tax=Nocardioides sp. GY 10127 TaxID=2569762 RepID=UPI0010A7B7C7|nr:TetR/AcrR family transcriptional regulator [Nocardioides sp. GY 10127]TIC82597.1 TetR/AcrR family transcriptional regulator [Nocardioides sp. GY 10127]
MAGTTVELDPEPPSPRRAARRDELLADLVALFLAEGFRAFGVGDLAARLHCSRSTLYLVADSKERIVSTAVNRYFRECTRFVEEKVDAERDPARRITAYLLAVAEALAPAGPAFRADLAAHAGAREVYRRNTAAAAARVRSLVDDGVAAGALRPVDAAFVGAAVARVMEGIQTGAVTEASGLDDAHAYRALADLVAHGLLER